MPRPNQTPNPSRKRVCTYPPRQPSDAQVSNLPFSHPFLLLLTPSTPLLLLPLLTHSFPPLFHQSHSIQATYIVSHSTLFSSRSRFFLSFARPSSPPLLRFRHDTQSYGDYRALAKLALTPMTCRASNSYCFVRCQNAVRHKPRNTRSVRLPFSVRHPFCHDFSLHSRPDSFCIGLLLLLLLLGAISAPPSHLLLSGPTTSSALRAAPNRPARRQRFGQRNGVLGNHNGPRVLHLLINQSVLLPMCLAINPRTK